MYFSIYGRFAEWLGAGLQNQLQRFESATDLRRIANSHYYSELAVLFWGKYRGLVESLGPFGGSH